MKVLNKLQPKKKAKKQANMYWAATSFKDSSAVRVIIEDLVLASPWLIEILIFQY